MSVLRLFLLPFALLFDVVTRFRNRMYAMGWRHSTSFDLPVICVGNLAVGGTGKTPMIEYLIRLLSTDKKIATLSRGYGRRTRGFRIAEPSDTPATLGDEPFQLYSKFKSNVVVSVGEDRALSIPLALHHNEDVGVVLLDDAFQHRRVKAGFSILLTDYNNPFYSDYLMPYGKLRENVSGAVRADCIVVTKCPPKITETEKSSIESRIRKYSNKPVYFSFIKYGTPVPLFNHAQALINPVVLVSGIANHQALEDHINSTYRLVKHFAFRDHHAYTRSDLSEIKKYIESLKEPVSIITTEKDKAKIDHNSLKPISENLPFFFLPIEMEIMGNGKEFDRMVTEFVTRGS